MDKMAWRYLARKVSSLETVERLDFLFDTESLKDEALYRDFQKKYGELNSMLYRFVESVASQHDISRVGNIEP